MTMLFTNKTHNHKILGRTPVKLEVVIDDKIKKMRERGLLIQIATLSLQNGSEPTPPDM